jgi:hypothetical protein
MLGKYSRININPIKRTRWNVKEREKEYFIPLNNVAKRIHV